MSDLDKLERLARTAPHMSHVRVLNTDLLALINRIRELEAERERILPAQIDLDDVEHAS